MRHHSHKPDLLARRRASFLEVLRILGIEREFLRLPMSLRNRLYLIQHRSHRPTLDPALAGVPGATDVCASVDDLLSRRTVDALGNGRLISWKEANAVVFSLHAGLRHFVQRGDPLSPLITALGPFITEPTASLLDRLNKELRFCVTFALTVHSRIDTRTYWPRQFVRVDPRTDRQHTDLLICGEPPRQHRFTLDGVPRPAYQMCGCLHPDGFGWVDWPADILGLPSGSPPLPVFVQSHTLHRLFQRLPKSEEFDNRGFLHSFLYLSLLDPEIVERQADTFWIALKDHRGLRLGYLLADVVDGRVLVKTFQFLTMDGSPEFRLLHRRLGARRADLQHLRLDDLATLIRSDLADDPDLRAIFDDCGCGHLFTLREAFLFNAAGMTPVADSIKRYFGLRDGRTAGGRRPTIPADYRASAA